jgi:hypothetical protein
MEPSAEQFRIASLLDEKKFDAEIEQNIKKVIEFTGCDIDKAAVALYDNDNNIEAACIKIIDSQTEEDSWAKVEKPQKKTEIRDEKDQNRIEHKFERSPQDGGRGRGRGQFRGGRGDYRGGRGGGRGKSFGDNQRTDLSHVIFNNVILKADSHGTVGAAVAVEVDNVADEVVDSEVVLNHQEIKTETMETKDEISDQATEKSKTFNAEEPVLTLDLTLDGEETRTMNGKKRKAQKSQDMADGKMDHHKNSKNLDGMNPTLLIRIIGPRQARNKIRIVKSRLGTMICRITVVDGAMKIAGMSHRFNQRGNQLFQNSPSQVAGKKHANGMKKKPSKQNELHQQHMFLHHNNNHVMRAAGMTRKIHHQRILLDHPIRTLRV